MTSLTARKYRVTTERISSGSRASPSAVEPVRSQKTTVTVRRTVSSGRSPVTPAPHDAQNRAAGVRSAPQAAQPVTGAA